MTRHGRTFASGPAGGTSTSSLESLRLREPWGTRIYFVCATPKFLISLFVARVNRSTLTRWREVFFLDLVVFGLGGPQVKLDVLLGLPIIREGIGGCVRYNDARERGLGDECGLS